MPIVGDHPANGVRFVLERPHEAPPPWIYRGHAFTPDARFALEVVVAEAGDVRAIAEDGSPADVAEKARLLMRALYKQADGPPPRKVVRWRGEK